MLQLGLRHPERIGGNDNLIGRVGEFIALRFLEHRGQTPIKVQHKSNPGYDLIEGETKTQVKVITEENQKRRTVRLKPDWNQFLLIELGTHYKPVRIGILTRRQHQTAISENPGWAEQPIVKSTMLAPRGLIGRYGQVVSGNDLIV